MPLNRKTVFRVFCYESDTVTDVHLPVSLKWLYVKCRMYADQRLKVIIFEEAIEHFDLIRSPQSAKAKFRLGRHRHPTDPSRRLQDAVCLNCLRPFTADYLIFDKLHRRFAASEDDKDITVPVRQFVYTSVDLILGHLDKRLMVRVTELTVQVAASKTDKDRTSAGIRALRLN